MKYLGRLAVLVLPVVAAMSVGGPASAAPDTVSASAAGFSPAAGVVSSVTNRSDVGLGVIRVQDGVYDLGLYDAVLPPNERTEVYFEWPQTEGIYVGPGYCADLLYWNGSRWVYDHTETGSKQVWLRQQIPGQNVATWEIQPYEC